MDNFDLKKYLAEGKIYEELNENKNLDPKVVALLQKSGATGPLEDLIDMLVKKITSGEIDEDELGSRLNIAAAVEEIFYKLMEKKLDGREFDDLK